MITPDMLINRTPHKPLSPFKVRRRGATAFWDAIKHRYPKYASDKERDAREREKRDAEYHAPKTVRTHAGEAVTSAFIKGWKDVWLDVEVTADAWTGYIAVWRGRHAEAVDQRDAYLAGREFYHEQFPEGSEKPILHPQRLAA